MNSDTLKSLLQFAKEDGIVLSDKRERGTAVNSYIRAAISDFTAARKARQTQAQKAPAKAEAKAEAKQPVAAR